MKVIGVGLSKTGTSTLGRCYRHWGLNYAAYDAEAEAWQQAGEIDKLLAKAEHFQAFEDLPWPLVYQEMDQKFDDCKFILTTRKDADTWFESLLYQTYKHSDNEEQKALIMYGFEVCEGNRGALKDYYLEHTSKIREYFKGRENQLLEVCWEHGHGWQELSAFLDFEHPSEPFPHANKRPGKLKKLRKTIKKWISKD